MHASKHRTRSLNRFTINDLGPPARIHR